MLPKPTANPMHASQYSNGWSKTSLSSSASAFLGGPNDSSLATIYVSVSAILSAGYPGTIIVPLVGSVVTYLLISEFVIFLMNKFKFMKLLKFYYL